MTRILLALLAFFALTAQRDPILVPEVSQHEIQVRQGFTGTELLLFGAILDPDGRRAWFKDEELQLTAKEFDLLRVLVREQGKVVSREQLMREIWETAWFGSTKTLDMHISVLRRKLGDDAAQPRYIATVRGVGFRFERGDGA